MQDSCPCCFPACVAVMSMKSHWQCRASADAAFSRVPSAGPCGRSGGAPHSGHASTVAMRENWSRTGLRSAARRAVLRIGSCFRSGHARNRAMFHTGPCSGSGRVPGRATLAELVVPGFVPMRQNWACPGTGRVLGRAMLLGWPGRGIGACAQNGPCSGAGRALGLSLHGSWGCPGAARVRKSLVSAKHRCRTGHTGTKLDPARQSTTVARTGQYEEDGSP